MLCRPSAFAEGGAVSVMIRFESLLLGSGSGGEQSGVVQFACRILRRTYLGSMIEYECGFAGGVLNAWVPNNSTIAHFAPGEAATITFNPADALLFARKG